MTASFSSIRKSAFLIILFLWIIIGVGCAVAPIVTSEGEQELGVKMAKEVEQWLLLRDPTLVPYIRHIENEVSTTGDETTFCILCGHNMGVCGYCFTREVLEFIHTKKPEMVDSFLENFGYGGSSLNPPDEFLAM